MNKLENARVLVIGAAGFIGGFVVSETKVASYSKTLKLENKNQIIYDIK